LISIVTPFLNGLDLLPDYEKATIGAELIIVDNGSEAATAEALQTLPPERGRVIRNASNLGFAAANNQGYAQAKGDIIVFLNSDIAAPDSSWLSLVADDVQEGSLYGPSLGVQLVAGRHIPYLEGWCVAATRATWGRICVWDEDLHGPWDSDAFDGPYWEDNDLCFRAIQQGIALVQTQWPIQHKGGRTAGALVKHAKSFEANRATFAKRVLAEETQGVHTPTYAAYQHHCVSPSDIQHHLPLLFSLAKGNVLELGTRSGVSTAALLAGVEKHGGRVFSIDIEDCSAVAKGHPQWTFIQGDSRDSAIVRRILDGPDGQPRAENAIDLLLIDSEHTYEMAQAELALWGYWVRPGGYICMHDPETFPGVRRAAQEFADAHGWPIAFVLPCHGMAVIRRPE
jgi:cephalosporin hydroxylase